ncbi:hypothetical protein G4B88_006829 [Cannabis sativa]|uniref:Uncharacterized protein n=1 Tax=Cannabis sativa TaxID=3483 RepID=A0A7J6DWY3_CANSA|nr:hypothetical protein G4B88_006829 [Cannabis sativa]
MKPPFDSICHCYRREEEMRRVSNPNCSCQYHAVIKTSWTYSIPRRQFVKCGESMEIVAFILQSINLLRQCINVLLKLGRG